MIVGGANQVEDWAWGLGRVFQYDGRELFVFCVCLMDPRTQGSSIIKTAFVQMFDS